VTIGIPILQIVQENENGLLSADPSWSRVPLGEVAQVLNGFAFSSKNFSRVRGKPLLRIRDILQDQTAVLYDGQYDTAYLVHPNDLVIGMDGDFNCALWKGPEALLNQRVCKVTSNELFYSSKFLKYVLPGYLQAVNARTSSQTVEHLSSKTVADIPLPLPPLPEQHRIVAKIEELFTKLDAGVEALKKIKAQLKRYRQSVLKHAFEGKLTEEWRQTHKHELEPASILLKRIREERQEAAKAKDLPLLDTNDLPELPEGWTYLTLDFLVPGVRNAIRRGPFGSAIKKAFFVSSGYKVYEQGNVIYNDFDRGSYYIDEKKFEEMKDFEVRPGDILMSCSGTVGKITIAPEGIRPGVINQALLKITLNNKIVDTSYFVYLFRSRVEEIMLANTRGSAMVNVSSVKDLRQIPFPISSVPEQHKIVEEIERHFSVADQIEKTVDHGLKQTERLRQSILKRAFEGKLVLQDPNDEPPEKLLERIRQERARQQAEGRSAKSSRNKSNTKQMRLV
jgi:type I restriction enzyme S subunit